MACTPPSACCLRLTPGRSSSRIVSSCRIVSSRIVSCLAVVLGAASSAEQASFVIVLDETTSGSGYSCTTRVEAHFYPTKEWTGDMLRVINPPSGVVVEGSHRRRSG